MAEKGLGAGLGALFGSAALEADAVDCVFLPIAKVEPGIMQPRKNFNEEALAELADSISEHGIIQPLTVRKLASGSYQIIAGERRWRAARLAGLSQVPARIVEADDRKAMELALVENLQREDLNPLEEADGYRRLIEEFGLTQEEAAGRAGKSRSAVTNSLRLLNLPETVKTYVEDGELTAGHARALLSLHENEALMLEAAKRTATEKLSVRETEKLVKRLMRTPARKPQTQGFKVDYIGDVERRLSSALGRGVKIVEGRKKGRIEIEYYDPDDLELMIDALYSLKTKAKTNKDAIDKR